MKCPKCDGKFEELRDHRYKIWFDRCEKCRGVWLDYDETWKILKHKKIKNIFKKEGLTNPTVTNLDCPTCSEQNTKLVSGLLPLTNLAVEQCNTCEGFYFERAELKSLKIQMLANNKNKQTKQKLNDLSNAANSIRVKSDDFSIKLFVRRLKNIKKEGKKYAKNFYNLSGIGPIRDFLHEFRRTLPLIFKEPEILFFGTLQSLSICVACLIGIEVLDWIKAETLGQNCNCEGWSSADIFFWLLSFALVGIVSIIIGFFTACIGVVHLLTIQGKNSSITSCMKLVFPRIWPIWIYSWLDGWITFIQILKRLPDSDRRSLKTKTAESMQSEIIYNAWKVGTMGIIPALITTNNITLACKNSLNFLKIKGKDLLKLRVGYITICWLIGILAYAAAIYMFNYGGINVDKIIVGPKKIYMYIILPIFTSVVFLHVVIRPFYVIAIFDTYTDYLLIRGQSIPPSVNNKYAKYAIWSYCLLVVSLFVVLFFKDQLGITKMLSNI